MKLLLGFLCLFNQGFIELNQRQPSIRIFVVRQQKFVNRGHHPENNRRVVFKMLNESNKPVIVYGFKYDGIFDPSGYIIELDKKTGQWVYPNPDNAPMPWSARSDLEKQKYILQPGMAFRFVAEMSRAEVGMHFKMTAYVSFKEDEEPIEIRGEEFILK